MNTPVCVGAKDEGEELGCVCLSVLVQVTMLKLEGACQCAVESGADDTVHMPTVCESESTVQSLPPF